MLQTPSYTINLDNLKIKKGKRQHFSSKVLHKKYIVKGQYKGRGRQQARKGSEEVRRGCPGWNYTF